MPKHEIGINDKIRGIYANLEDIKRLREESKGHFSTQEIFRKIREHEAENLRIIQELNGQGVTNDEIQRRLQEVPILMHDGYSNHNASRCLPSKMKTTQTKRPWDRIIEFVHPVHEPSIEFQLPPNRPHMALLRKTHE
jgi:hypothetical protein